MRGLIGQRYGGKLIPMIIAFAVISGVRFLFSRMLFSILPIRKTGIWVQIIISSLFGVILWITLAVLMRYYQPNIELRGGDILCGSLILLCAFWCNYWLSNISDLFREQMQIRLQDQSQPVPLEEGMSCLPNNGMVFSSFTG